jgi:lysozyme
MPSGKPSGGAKPRGSSKPGTRLGIAGAVTALGLLATAVIGNYEGLRLYAYKDVIGVWTACYGETKGIKPGMKFTKDQCDVMFIESLTGYEQQMRYCLNNPDEIPMKTYVAFLSLAYNIGGGGFCKSSIVRDWNAGRAFRACDDLLKYVKAGGRTIQGLVTRRKAERKLCLAGLNEGTL